MAVDILNLGYKVDTSQVKTAAKDLDKLSDSTSLLSTSMKGLGAAIGVYAIANTIKEVATLATRYDELGIVMTVVGRNAGYTAEQMNKQEEALRKTGISMIESRANLAKLAAAHIDLSKATDLARLAQDAAVIGGVNSSDAFARLVTGIQTAQTETLRTLGINVSFENSYVKLAATLKKTTQDLTEVEKTQARVNAVMEVAPDIAGAYESAMTNAGKQIRSSTRYIEDLKVKLGGVFNEVLVKSVEIFTSSIKDASGEMDQLKENKSLEAWSNAILTIFEAITVPIVNIIYVLKVIGAEIVGQVKMLEALSRFDFKGAIAIGDQVGKDTAQYRVEVDKLTASLLKRNDASKSNTPTNEAQLIAQAQQRQADQAKADADAKKLANADKVARKQEEIDRVNRELLSSIEELVSGDRTHIQVLQDKLDHNKKITDSNRKLAQSNLDLAKSLDFEAADRAAFDQGLQNESEIFDENYKQNQDYTDRMSANYESMSDRLQKENEDLNASLITNDKARALEQSRIAHERALEQIQLNTDVSQGQDDLIAKENENYRLRNLALDESQQLVKDLGMTFTSAFEDAVVAGKKLSDVLQSLLQDILKLVTRQLITNPLMSAIGGALQGMMPSLGGADGYAGATYTGPTYTDGIMDLVPSANGNIMTSKGAAKLNTYANGGIATSPQVSLFGEGRMNEAYVPLPDGRSIPVSMKGGGSNVQVVVNNNTPAQATTSESIDSRGNRRIEVTISELVAGEIKRNGSSANNAIKSTFNTTPTLIGR